MKIEIEKVESCWGAYWYAIRVDGIVIRHTGSLSHAQEIVAKIS